MLTNILLSITLGLGIFFIVISLRYQSPKKDLDRIIALSKTEEEAYASDEAEDSFYRNIRKRGLEVALAQADLPVTPAGFMRVGIIISVVTFALGYVISGGLIAAVFMALGSFYLYYFWLGLRRDSMKLDYEEAIADTCERLSAGAMLSPTIQGAISHAAETCPDIIKSDLVYIDNLLTQGAGIDAAFADVIERRQSYSLALMAQTLKIWSVRGTTTPLSEIIKPLKESIREMSDTGRRMNSELTQSRLTATIVTVAPPAFVLFYRIAIPSTDPIFSSFSGQLTQIIAYGLAAAGFMLCMRRIRKVRQVLDIEQN